MRYSDREEVDDERSGGSYVASSVNVCLDYPSVDF